MEGNSALPLEEASWGRGGSLDRTERTLVGRVPWEVASNGRSTTGLGIMARIEIVSSIVGIQMGHLSIVRKNSVLSECSTLAFPRKCSFLVLGRALALGVWKPSGSFHPTWAPSCHGRGCQLIFQSTGCGLPSLKTI